jgi:hypothetical protein
MSSMLPVTSTALRARACAAIAASKSSMRVPFFSRPALIVANASVTSSVHSALGSSERIHRACVRPRRAASRTFLEGAR